MIRILLSILIMVLVSGCVHRTPPTCPVGEALVCFDSECWCVEWDGDDEDGD